MGSFGATLGLLTDLIGDTYLLRPPAVGARARGGDRFANGLASWPASPILDALEVGVDLVERE